MDRTGSTEDIKKYGITPIKGGNAETKETLGGFYVLDCKDLDEAIKWAARIPGAWYGRVEVRPLIDFSQGG